MKCGLHGAFGHSHTRRGSARREPLQQTKYDDGALFLRQCLERAPDAICSVGAVLVVNMMVTHYGGVLFDVAQLARAATELGAMDVPAYRAEPWQQRPSVIKSLAPLECPHPGLLDQLPGMLAVLLELEGVAEKCGCL